MILDTHPPVQTNKANTHGKIAIFANGLLYDSATLKKRLQAFGPDIVVAADGGYWSAREVGYSPSVIVGDFDSINENHDVNLDELDVDLLRAPRAKDETDLELALQYAVEQGGAHIVMLTALGGRIDMAMANLLLMLHPIAQQVRIEVWQANQTIWLIKPPGDTCGGKPGDTLSLIPFGGDAIGITTSHLEYSLNDENLYLGPARGVSNVLLTDEAHIKLREGALLAIHTPGKA